MKYLHSMVRVRDLDASLRFYCEGLGLREARRKEVPEGKYTLVFLSAPDSPEAELELTYNWGSQEDYGSARNFGHLAFRVDDIYATCERLQAMGCTIHRALARPDLDRVAAGRPSAAPRTVGIDAEHRQLVSQPRASRSAPRAASRVSAMSLSLCALDMKPASNADGARYTPRFSMPWKKRLNSATSAAVACA